MFLNLEAKVEFMKMSTPQQKAQKKPVFMVYRDKARHPSTAKL